METLDMFMHYAGISIIVLVLTLFCSIALLGIAWSVSVLGYRLRLWLYTRNRMKNYCKGIDDDML